MRRKAFRSGNVDLPVNHTNLANPASLTLPDVLTELDLLAPMPDPSLLLSQAWDEELNGPDPTLLDYGSSQRFSSSVERARAQSAALSEEEDVELDLDLGEDIATPARSRREIEIGRDAPQLRSLREDLDDTMQLYEGNDLNLDLGEDTAPPAFNRDSSILTAHRDPLDFDKDGDTGMGGMDFNTDLPAIDDDTGFPALFADTPLNTAQLPRQRDRETLSPLSSLRSSVERELEETFNPEGDPTAQLEDEEESVHLEQRAKKRRVLLVDRTTELKSSEVRSQQEDRSKILKPLSLLPRDPMLLALINMQRNGDFASNILGDGRSKGWAPELRGILSLEVIRSTTQLKRKRGTGASTSTQESLPQLQFDTELDAGLDMPLGFDAGADVTVDETIVQLRGSDDLRGPQDEEPLDDATAQSLEGNEQLDELAPLEDFDETVAPLLHPQESGPISSGTKHAVHLLRERFGAEAADSPNRRRNGSVLFQDLLPEKQTTRADATKMFFEILVLATKDAIKVEQAVNELGGPLRIKAKRGLWGPWAEREAGGEIAEQEAEGVTA